MRGRQNQSVMGSLVETMLWWGERRISSPGEEKCLVYSGQGRAFELTISLNHHYRVRPVEARQLRGVNTSILSSTGSVADSADSASSSQPAEHRQAQEPVRYPPG